MSFNNIFTKPDKLSMAGVMSFLTVISIANITTTHASYGLVEIIRFISLLVLFVCLSVMMILRKIEGKKIIFMGLYILLMLYAIFIAYFNNVKNINEYNSLLNIIIAISGALIFTHASPKIINYAILKYYFHYVMFALAIMVLTGGLVLEGVPKFVYDVASEQIGREENYSLGISNFFGFAALAAAANVFPHRTLHTIIVYTVASFFFIALSFLGGGRGESVIAIVMVLFIFLTKRPGATIFTLVIGAIFFVSIISSIDLEDFAITQRLAILFDGDLSSRDSLLMNGAALLANETRCALIGCGIGYFQYYHSYESGMYPHNSLLESVIIFGIPVTFCIGTLATLGMYKYYILNNKKIDVFLLFFIYSLIVSLKSGSLLGSWFLMASLLYFCTLGFAGAFRCNSQ